MSAMLMTESWATEVRSYPWPQCVKVVPQDKQHYWHTLHRRISNSIFVRDVKFPLAMKQYRCGARSTPFYESALRYRRLRKSRKHRQNVGKPSFRKLTMETPVEVTPRTALSNSFVSAANSSVIFGD